MQHLLHSTIFLSLFYVFYWLLLRRETYYALNRWLLVGIILISIGLPYIKIPQTWSINASNIEVITAHITTRTNANSFNTSSKDPIEIDIKENTSVESFTSIEILWYFYMAGVLIFSIAFLIQLGLLFYKKRQLEYIQDGNCKIYELTGNKPPFSFYNWVFINPSLYDNETYEQIIAHEKIHILETHFIDKLIAELVLVQSIYVAFTQGNRKQS